MTFALSLPRGGTQSGLEQTSECRHSGRQPGQPRENVHSPRDRRCVADGSHHSAESVSQLPRSAAIRALHNRSTTTTIHTPHPRVGVQEVPRRSQCKAPLDGIGEGADQTQDRVAEAGLSRTTSVSSQPASASSQHRMTVCSSRHPGEPAVRRQSERNASQWS